jgi:hypothetical protein
VAAWKADRLVLTTLREFSLGEDEEICEVKHLVVVMSLYLVLNSSRQMGWRVSSFLGEAILYDAVVVDIIEDCYILRYA